MSDESPVQQLSEDDQVGIWIRIEGRYGARREHYHDESTGALLDDTKMVLRDAGTYADHRVSEAEVLDWCDDALKLSMGLEEDSMTYTELTNAYGTAIDEIHRLRQLLAYTAAGQATDLGYASYPKSRRALAQTRVENAQAAARGEAATVLAPMSYLTLRHVMGEAGAEQTLTRHQFEVGQGLRNPDGTIRRRAPRQAAGE